MRIKTETFIDVVTSIFLFNSFFAYLSGLERMFQCFCIVCLLPYVIVNRKIFLDKHFFKLNLIICSLSIWIIISSYISRTITFYEKPASFYGIFIVAIGFLCASLIIESFIKRKRQTICLKTFYACALVYMLISVFQILSNDNIEDGAGYLVGTKFQVSYLSVFILALSYTIFSKSHKNFPIIVIIHFVVALIVSMYVKCSTSIVGLMCLGLFLIFPKIGFYCSKPLVVIIALLICDSALLFFQSILSIPSISFFIENVLGEDITLSSRTLIYANLPILLDDMPLTGYGLGNSYAVCHPSIGAPNAQNGLVDFMLQIGIPGIILAIIVLMTVFSKSRPLKRNRGILAMIWFYLIISSVEITFDLSFLLLSLFLMSYDSTTSKENKKKLIHIKF